LREDIERSGEDLLVTGKDEKGVEEKDGHELAIGEKSSSAKVAAHTD
jgi:hypothetical protein